MLAAELAYRLGADLGLESVEGIWQEIERLAPAHAGITVDLLESPAGSDGVLVPLRPEVAAAAEGTHVQITGVQGTQPDSGELARAEEHEKSDSEPTGGESPEEEAEHAAAEAADAQAEAESDDRRPDTIRFERGERYEAPAVDSYSLRLVTTRKLFDNGTLVQHSPSIAHLVGTSRLLVNSYDLDRLGVSDGGAVKVTSPRGSARFDVHATSAVPKGTAAVVLNQAGANANVLIDATTPVTEIRVEGA
jgi:predicted molibdopterin-dependent oxidoreductase YjgC